MAVADSQAPEVAYEQDLRKKSSQEWKKKSSQAGGTSEQLGGVSELTPVGVLPSGLHRMSQEGERPHAPES